MSSGQLASVAAAAAATVVWTSAARAAEISSSELVASISPVRSVVPVGEPVWVDFLLANTGAEPVTLTVPGTTPAEATNEAVGLPIEHVFSGAGFRGVSISREANEPLGERVVRPVAEAPVVTLEPGGLIGRRVDLLALYPPLRQPGVYYLQWFPYNAQLTSNRVKLRIAQLQQAVLETDLGKITIRFHYETAPRHVENFLELAAGGFYDGKTFHRVLPGTLIQGGCPRGDGSGVRPDGKTLKAEFSDLPHRLGTVSMARKADDPDSASCQFFICLMRIPEFDERYTVFGEVVGEESFEALRRFNDLETDRYDRPYQPIKIVSVFVEPTPAGVRPLDVDSPPALANPAP